MNIEHFNIIEKVKILIIENENAIGKMIDYELMMNVKVKKKKKAPDFDAVTTFGNISLKDYKGKWLILFSHPGDFTPVKSASLDEIIRVDGIIWNVKIC